ncbi:hypothetical protein XFF6992_220113 [Xanthomonas citri pv. fuscans]|nr:hypothetical protein XFF6992_220113 [Xanthomonas citri pv. fuscans]SOO31840.1 hypothetical protein XFF6994_1570007 [Xanthomonas citri pv. fuscans]
MAPLHPMRRWYSATHGYMPLLAEGKWQRSLAMRVALLTLHEARLGACRQRTMATHAAAASLQRS